LRIVSFEFRRWNACHQNGTFPDAARDARRLLGPVVENIELGLMYQVATVTQFAKRDRRAAADHALLLDAIDLTCYLTDEIMSTARYDVVRKPVSFEKAQ
jgi:hypothetical protein